MAERKTHTVRLTEEQERILYVVTASEGKKKTEVLQEWVALGMAQYWRNRTAGFDKPLQDPELKHAMVIAYHILDAMRKDDVLTDLLSEVEKREETEKQEASKHQVKDIVKFLRKHKRNTEDEVSTMFEPGEVFEPC